MDTPVPFDEDARLESLNRYALRDPQEDRQFDRLVALAASVCRTPIALLGFMDRDRLSFKSTVGLAVAFVPRRISFGAHAICKPDEIMVVPDARHDARFAKSPLVTREPRVRFYAAAPLVESSGHAIGTLAIMDYVARGLSDPERLTLHTLADQVVALLDLRQKVRRLEGEISERTQYERRLTAFQQQLQTTNALLGAASLTDSLTRLSNRRAFEQRLATEVDRVNRLLYPLSLLLIDIDHFKQINDTFGHPAGDQIIRRVAEIIGRTARTTDFAARLGGDEFAVILPGTDSLGAAIIAERYRAAIEASRWPNQHPVRISVGVGQILPDALDGSELIVAADQALLRAKQSGRNRVAVKRPDPHGERSIPTAPRRRGYGSHVTVG